MPQVDVNWWGVVAGVVVSMVLGFVWYSMPVFGKMWSKEIGKSEKELQEGGGATMYIQAIVVAAILAYVMTHFVSYAGASDAMEGATVGFWAWLGFSATSAYVTGLFEGKSVRLFAINSGYHLVEFLIIGAIIANMMNK